MSAVWLMWCDCASYRWMRRELRDRCGADRILRLNGLPSVLNIVDGLGDELLCAAVYVGSDVQGIEQAEQICAALARTGRIAEIVACMDEVDAGYAARCFHAGATEVIAAGGADACEYVCPKARSEERDALEGDTGVEPCSPPASDDAYRHEDSWAEEPPWDVGCERESSAGASPASTDAEAFARVPSAVCEGGSNESRRAPVVTVISGRGGVGKTTLVAAMATCAARAGLRTAVLDLDLMFGNMSSAFGVSDFKGIEGVGLHAGEQGLAERDVEGTATRVGPGLTMWGPCEAPERAELCARPIEQLVGLLRTAADVIFVDTSGFWGDAVAMAVASCDRCLVVGSVGASAASSGKRAVELASRLGVPRTRMTCVFNRMGLRGCGEEEAIAFEMGTALRSRTRIVDGGDEVMGMLSFGQMQSMIAGSSAFAQGVRTFTVSLLRELGCPIEQWLLTEEQRRVDDESRMRFRLPWKQRPGDAL